MISRSGGRWGALPRNTASRSRRPFGTRRSYRRSSRPWLAAHALKPAEDLEKLRIRSRKSLLSHLAAQRARLLIAQDASLEAEQFGLVAQLASGVHRNIELVGKYLGEFASHTTLTTISILVTPEYLDLRATLLRALQPYGDARRAVAAAFLQVEEKAAQRSAATAQHPPQLILDGGAHADT